jgi:predicted amidohydrolase
MKFRVAAIQMLATDDKAANLGQAAQFVRDAAAQGASVVALPEVFLWRGDKTKERQIAERIPGPSSQAMAELARGLGIHLLAGSMLEEVAASGKVYNASLLFDPAGKLIAKYRKIHLFDVALENGISVKESDTRASGESLTVATSDLCLMGMSICYDLRFPELYRGLAQQGAQVIFVPSAFTSYTGKAHWEPLLRARAIENQVYIIAPDQYGENPKSFATYGHSMIIDPWGKIAAELPEGPGVTLAEVDLDYLAKVRAELPALMHRKLF